MAVIERHALDSLRSEVQRRLAAQIDVGTPEPTPPEPEPVAPQGVERRRFDRIRAEAQRSVAAPAERRSLASLLPTGRHGRLMRPSRIALVLVALVAGGIAAFLATQHDPVSPPIVQQVAKAAPVVTTKILVAKQTIDVGERLTPAMLEWQDWPQSTLRPE
jgi:pilus assembly protein CpaB